MLAPLPEAPRFLVGAATADEKIYPTSPPRGAPPGPIRLSLAGNETRSFQLVVAPSGADLRDVTVSFSALVGAKGGSVAAAGFRWSRVGYVAVDAPPVQTGRVPEPSHEPDPLLPAAPFPVPAHEVRAVWVDLRLPEGTPEDVYAGAVTISAAGGSVTLRVEVEAAGFDLPKRSSLENDLWFIPVYGWRDFYRDQSGAESLAYTPALHARHAEVLGRYRVSSFPSDWTFLSAQVPVTAEPDGHYGFDFTRFDQYVANAVANGSTAFSVALSCNSGWTSYLNSPSLPILERATGRRRTLAEVMQSKWVASHETDDESRFYGKSQFENPVYRDFLVAYVAHLKALGINERSYYELFDEANQDPTPRRWLAMIEHHRFFRQLVPELRLLDFGYEPTIVKGGADALGLTDVWAPHLFQLADDRVQKAIQERRGKHGEKFWFYTCSQQKDAAGNWTPYVFYHQPYIAARMHAWFAWLFGADGFLVYALNAVPKANLKPPDQRWPKSEWSDGGQRGTGTLVYPGPDFELVPGMRLASLRDGLEDYEYFALLRSLSRRLDPQRQRELLAAIDRALTIEGDIITSVFVWTKEAARLDAKRRELATLIRRAQADPDSPAFHLK